MSGSTTAMTATLIAVQEEERRRKEEESTNYSGNDLNDWEFKIVRSEFSGFKDPEKLKEVIERENKAGWILLEKFDDHRLRFKRNVSFRENDANLDFDPYKTNYNGSGWWIILLIIIGSIIFIPSLFLIFFIFFVLN